MAYQSLVQSVEYAVNASGDAIFQPYIASTDSPDYTADKVEANVQARKLSPLAVEKPVA